MHQILIVEDDPALSQGIRLALGQEGRQFVQAGTIGQAERELAERTGYSAATISRILSGDPALSVSMEARRKTFRHPMRCPR